ncbi:MAG: hemolysin family protein [Acidimicrobiia bacterium]
MAEAIPELLLVLGLVLVNAVLAGSEIALISLRESQLDRLERTGGAGRVVSRLARDPNRFLATIQIGITLSGFLASAAAAVTLAEPLVPYLGGFGKAADTVAIVSVTLILSFLTLVIGELAPKRLALQRSEAWAKLVAFPLHWLSAVSRPVVWVLSRSTDLVVRLLGGEPGIRREEIDLEELRDMVIANRSLQHDHQEILLGAFEVADRTVGQVMTPRPDVMTLTSDITVADAIVRLAEAGHTRAPVVPPDKGLDDAFGIAYLLDLLRSPGDDPLGEGVGEPLILPESVDVLDALRRIQDSRQQMALVVDEFGGIEGIVTAEDLVEELVGEIYDESDPDVLAAEPQPDGTILVSGRFPVHDLSDLGVVVPGGDYSTVAGLVLEELGRMPAPGDTIQIGEWAVEVESVGRRTVTRVRLRRSAFGASGSLPNGHSR